MKVRAWQEQRETRTLVTDDGPMVVQRGDIVLVAIVKSWEDAAKLMVPPEPVAVKE